MFINFRTRTIVGYREMITISFDGTHEYYLTATMDTGNSGIYPTIGANILEQSEEYVKFTVQSSYCSDPNQCEILDIEGSITPKVGKEKQERPVVKCAYIKICGRTLKNTYVALADRSFKKTQALMNRNIMTDMKMLVDPSATYLYGDSLPS